ncbi:MAG: WbqC family protein [bacterium]
MKVAIMQPYFMPYIGYFQLINMVDKYVVYDNIQYTKKGWINRNRILKNGVDVYITIPLEKDSDFIDICERLVADNFNTKNFLNQIIGAYKNAPYFNETLNLIEQVVSNRDRNLFDFIFYSIVKMCEYLDIETEILISSNINIDHSLKGKDKVIHICKALNADPYINSIGGLELYDKNEFMLNGIELKFIKTNEIVYKQFGNDFVSNLSIIDVMMFNSKKKIKEMLNEYELR